MQSRTSPILITAALPYANGDIHLGHMVEYIQTDIYTRFLRGTEHDVVFLCADDCHGTPIQIKARELKITPELLIGQFRQRHERDFRDFGVQFDLYHSTHSEECKRQVYEIFERLNVAGYIRQDSVEQYFCDVDGIYLPDRFLRARCPNPDCGAQDQYGDVCEVCGTHYEALHLENVKCAICGGHPSRRTSNHYFFRLSRMAKFLEEWVSADGHLQEETRNWAKQWLRTGLKDWDISRDAPYFGFPVPGSVDQFFYVWLDAPIGYLGTTQRFCAESGREFREYWQDPGAKIFHFIGKDITYFHVLFWPAVLAAAGYNLPTSVFVHGFLTVGGKKMSKTRGTFILARTYLDFLDPEHLRFYYASKLTGRADDLDLNLDDFAEKVNGELIHQVVNLPSRIGPLFDKLPGRHIGNMSDEGHRILEEIAADLDSVETDFGRREYARAVRTILEMSSKANKYISDCKPWELARIEPETCRQVCCFGVHAVRLIFTCLNPVIPQIAKKVAGFLGLDQLTWRDARTHLSKDHHVCRFVRLSDRVDPARLLAMREASRATLEQS